MKHVVILHGTGETPDHFWYPWLKKNLQERGFSVSIPQLPDTDNPTLTNWLPAARKEFYTEDTIIIGHSAGCPLLLSVLEKSHVQIKQAILVAGFVHPLGKKELKDEPILQETYDWGEISTHVKDIFFINSDNDPWGCTDSEGRYMLDALNKGTLIIPKGQGHMGSGTFNQPFTEFPLLLKLLD